MNASIPRRLFCISLALAVIAPFAAAQEPRWAWQKAQAKVLAQGDLEWAPAPWSYPPGSQVKYIDYENGDDTGPGTREEPWKHHPWDPEARGSAANQTGPVTYVFKCGVVYRGQLVANSSGNADEPIHLTSDPSWGQGDAMIYGSVRLDRGWRRCRPEDAPESMPETQKVWYMDIGRDFYPRSLWLQREDGSAERIHLARSPNWKVVDVNDVMSQWWLWEHTRTEEVDIRGNPSTRVWGANPRNLSGLRASPVGGTVWSEYSGVMGSPYANRIEAWNPRTGEIRFSGPWSSAGRHPDANQRYFIENLPALLDSDGEYWYADQGEFAGRIYVRLPDGAEPNGRSLELARHVKFLTIRGHSHIRVSGLVFRFGNVAHWYDRWWNRPDLDASCVTLLDDVADVTIDHCRFEHVGRAFQATPLSPGTHMRDVAFTDNDVRYTDYGAIDAAQGAGSGDDIGVLERLSILRNRLRDIGRRPARAHHGHAVRVAYARTAHIAGNILERTGGAGLFLFAAKGFGETHDAPLSRMIVHHNKVTYPLLRTNDWGGIEMWQSGPFYVYNNVSGAPGGYWHYRHLAAKDPGRRGHASARFGFAYYLDGGFKTYLFNNIAWGQSSDLSSPLTSTCALQEIIGFMNAFFNNSFYRFGAGSRRQAPMAGRCYYLGNIFQDMGEFHIRHAHPREAPSEANAADEYAAGDPEAEVYEYETLGYARNIFHGKPRDFGLFEHIGKVYPNLKEFRKALQARNALMGQVGTVVEKPPMPRADEHDFRLDPAGQAVDGGVKFFVPWSLSAVVGEWNFYRHPGQPQRILGENWYMTEEYYHRSMYRFVPLRDLRAMHTEAEDYIDGQLEDWVPGALRFDGKSRYCTMTHEDMTADYRFSGGDRQRKIEGSFRGADRKTLDMQTNDFLIELVLRTDSGHTGGVLVAKTNSDAGYRLAVNADGGVTMQLSSGTFEKELASTRKINDGKWHHLICQVDRAGGEVRFYIDSKEAGAGSLMGFYRELSLSNAGDFLVGKGPEGHYFAGAIDYLRVTRSTLKASDTSIEELYAWQFDGPFLRDFTGSEITGSARDAGALEAQP